MPFRIESNRGPGRWHPSHGIGQRTADSGATASCRTHSKFLCGLHCGIQLPASGTPGRAIHKWPYSKDTGRGPRHPFRHRETHGIEAVKRAAGNRLEMQLARSEVSIRLFPQSGGQSSLRREVDDEPPVFFCPPPEAIIFVTPRNWCFGGIRLSWCHMTPKVDWSAVAERVKGLG